MNNAPQHIKYYLIGVSNAKQQRFTDEVLQVIVSHRMFSGGNRHLELVKHLLPDQYDWIPVKGKMDKVVEAYQQHDQPIAIFVSGDPFFYGFGNTLQRLIPGASIKAYPYFNCIQLLSHRLHLNYSKVCSVSVHGREWDGLDHALLTNQPLIGILTDQHKSPQKIAQRLLEYNYDNYTISIGEDLEGDDEKVTTLPLQEATHYNSTHLNCVILEATALRKNALGIADKDFTHLDGRPGMITKRPIRLTTLSALQLQKASVFWDVGSCTGSIAIEAKSMFPELSVTAFEKRPECQDILQSNVRKFRTPGIQIVIDDIFQVKLSDFERPDTIFIGGHGNRLVAMIELMSQYLSPGGIMGMNTVKASSEDTFKQATEQLGFLTTEAITMKVNDYNTIKILTATKPKK